MTRKDIRATPLCLFQKTLFNEDCRTTSLISTIKHENSTQNYNRYSYCINNPLKYTDPSGYEYFGQGLCESQLQLNIEQAQRMLVAEQGQWMDWMHDRSMQIADMMLYDALGFGSIGGGSDADPTKGPSPDGEPDESLIALANFLHTSPTFAGVIANPFKGAVAISGDFGPMMVGSELDIGSFFILVGEDIGKFMSYTEKAGGLGSDFSAGGELTGIFYSGDISTFRTGMLYSPREKVFGGFSIGPLGFGGAYCWSKCYNGETLKSYSLSVSFGFSILGVLSFGYNNGYVDYKY